MKYLRLATVMRIKSTLLLGVIGVFLINGCTKPNQYENMINLNPINTKGITNLESDSKYVIFDILKNKSIDIVSVSKQFNDSDIKAINNFNKKHSIVRSCLFLTPKNSSICSYKIHPNIYLHETSRKFGMIVSTLVVSPLFLVGDTTSLLAGDKPTLIKDGLVKKAVDKDFVTKIGKVIDAKLYKEYLQKKKENSLKNFYTKYDFPKLQAETKREEELEKKRIIQRYRNRHTSFSYLEAYKLSKNKADLKKATKLAKTKLEKLKTEKYLLKDLEFSKVFTIKEVSSSSTSEFHNFIGENISIMKNISEISSDNKTLSKKFLLIPKIPLIGNYKINVDFILETTMKMKSNLLNGWLGQLANGISQTSKKTYHKTFSLNSKNSYKDIQEVEFKIVGVSTSALGMTMRSNIVGLEISTKIRDIKED